MLLKLALGSMQTGHIFRKVHTHKSYSDLRRENLGFTYLSNSSAEITRLMNEGGTAAVSGCRDVLNIIKWGKAERWRTLKAAGRRIGEGEEERLGCTIWWSQQGESIPSLHPFFSGRKIWFQWVLLAAVSVVSIRPTSIFFCSHEIFSH